MALGLGLARTEAPVQWTPWTVAKLGGETGKRGSAPRFSTETTQEERGGNGDLTSALGTDGDGSVTVQGTVAVADVIDARVRQRWLQLGFGEGRTKLRVAI